MSHVVTAAPRSPGLCRGVAALTVAMVATMGGGLAAPPRAAAASGTPASEPLVVLLRDHLARAHPSRRARRIETVAARRPLTGVRTLLPVLDELARDGRSWIRVRLPGRPNGHSGWIRRSHTRVVATPWHLSIRLSTRRVTVYRDGRVARRFRAVVGAPSTPTPRGRYFIEEALALSPFDHGGPYALATSARSNVLQEFEGGPGQIALHGTTGLSGTLGTAASHGCIRLSTRAITWLARRVGRGAALTISR
jgi:L,D-transpeptidase catalytic domain